MKVGIGVGVIVLNDEGNILLGLRNPNKHKASSELKGEGTWTMPGGKVEFMETLEDAAIREVKEETDLNVEQIEFICISDDMTDTAHYVTVGFIAKEYTGEVKAMEPDTILRWKWFNLDDLPNNLYEPSRKCIDKYKSHVFYKK